MPRKLLIDLDDTLVPAGIYYRRANVRCLDILHQAWGHDCPPDEEILALVSHIDHDILNAYEYHPMRFPSSWTMAFRRLIIDHGLPFGADLVEAINGAAKTYQDGPFIPFPGVVETLRALTNDGHELFMVTAARQAERFQNQKIDLSNLRQFFDQRIFITGREKLSQYQELLRSADLRGVVIGDSPKHDIVPGKAVGAWTIKVGQNGWTFTHADVTPDYTVEHFRDVYDIIEQLPR